MKKTYIILITLFSLLISSISISYSQVLISSGNGNPRESAMLEIRSNSKGLLIPRMNTSQRNSISNPVNGLLVYDNEEGRFYLYGRTLSGALGWNDLSTPAGIWETNSSNVYLSSSYTNVGVGTNSPDGKFVVKADGSKAPDDALFEIQDASGTPVFVVTSEGARIYVKDFTTSKGVSGGFAVGRYGAAKGMPDTSYFVVTADSTRVYSQASGVSGGFAVGRYGAAKGPTTTIFSTNPDSTRIYTKVGAKGVSGGFAVGRYGAAKGPGDNYMHMTRDNYLIGHRSGMSMTTGLYNLFLGFETGIDNTIGSENIFTGYQSGFSNIGGNRNIFSGYQSGYFNTSGIQNNFIGYRSGYSNTTGRHNNFYGYESGYSNTTADRNTFMGYRSGHSNTVGVDNVFIGAGSGFFHSSGNNNIFIGNAAGYGDAGGETGANNVYIGFQSGMSNTIGGNNVFLGNRAGLNNTTGTDNVLIGNAAGRDGTDAGQNVFIGYWTGRFHNAGSENVYLGDEAGQGDASYTGTAERNVVLGAGAGSFINNAVDNVFIGHLAGQGLNSGGISGDYNVIIGEQAGNSISSGSNNVFMGTKAGQVNSSGYSNVFMGFESGLSNTIGAYNIFIGNEAGHTNITGQYNVFIGYLAGENNGLSSPNGYSNVFIGNEAGRTNETGHNNCYIGTWAGGITNTAGIYNTMIGSSAGSNSTGNFNTFVGKSAGSESTTNSNTYVGTSSSSYNVTGANNVTIGHYSGFWSTAGSNNVIIGKDAASLANGQTLGDGNVLIGYKVAETQTGISNRLFIDNSNTSTPLIYGEFDNNLVKIFSNLNINNAYTFPNIAGSNGDVLVTDGSGNVSWQSPSTLSDGDWTVNGNNMYSVVSGDVGIGTSSPLHKLHIYDSNTATSGSDGAFIDIENPNATNGVMSGIRFKTNNQTDRFKGGIFYQRTGTYGRGDIIFANDAGVNVTNVSAADSRMIIKNNGKIGIGTTSIASYTDLQQNASNDNGGAGGYAAFFFNDGNSTSHRGLRVQAGTDDATGTNYMIRFFDGDGGYEGAVALTNGTLSLVQNSDKNLKSNIIDTKLDAVDIIDNIRVVDYSFKDISSVTHTGFIAQELKSVFPQMVTVDDETGIYGISESRLVPVLTKAIQEQNLEIELLKKTIEELRTENEIFASKANKIDELEKQINELKDLIKK